MNAVDSIFIELLTKKPVIIQFQSHAAFISMRVMLYRRLESHIKQWDDLGYLDETLRGMTVGVKLKSNEDESAVVATFNLVKRRTRHSFTIISGTPDHEAVPTNLEHHQEGQIQHGSPSPSSQEHGEDANPSSTQGKSNGQCVAEEDWESELRKFIQSDSPTQD